MPPGAGGSTGIRRPQRVPRSPVIDWLRLPVRPTTAAAALHKPPAAARLARRPTHGTFRPLAKLGGLVDSDVKYVPSDCAVVGLKSDPQHVLAIDDEPSHFLHRHDGHVTLYEGEGGDDAIEIGRYRAYYVDAEGALNAGVPLHDVLDAMQATCDYLELYDLETGSFSEAAKKAGDADWLFEPNLLILDRLEILPRYRGRGYGLQALVGMMHWFQSGAGLVAMKPFPLQSEASIRRPGDPPDPLELDKFPRHHIAARTKLRRYYSQLGFKLVTKTDFMVRRVDRALPKLP